MGAPLSPRTQAILDAVAPLHAGATVRDLVDALDRQTPDATWSALTTGNRRATVRRYLGRLVDDGHVVRLDEAHLPTRPPGSTRRRPGVPKRP